jgi:hypothetical protein
MSKPFLVLCIMGLLILAFDFLRPPPPDGLEV